MRKFQIIRKHSLAELEIRVNLEMKKAWRVEGSPFYVEQTDKWCQAMYILSH